MHQSLVTENVTKSVIETFQVDSCFLGKKIMIHEYPRRLTGKARTPNKKMKIRENSCPFVDLSFLIPALSGLENATENVRDWREQAGL